MMTRSGSSFCVLFLLSGVLACQGPRRTTRAPLLEDARRIPAAQLSRIEAKNLRREEGRSLLGELGALHLLYDLVDRARFASDDHARALLWESVEPGPQRRGELAFRHAVSTLLDRAWSLEQKAEQSPEWNETAQRSLSQLIMLLSMDVNVSAGPEQIESLALGLRSLQEDALPEIQDNLWWRIYDYERAIIDRILQGDAAERLSLIRYAERLVAPPREQQDQGRGQSTLDRWLGPWLLARRSLHEDPRWSATIQSREAKDQADLQRLIMIVAVDRRYDWNLPQIDPQGLLEDPLGPLILLRDGLFEFDGRKIEAGTRRVAQISEQMAISGSSRLSLAADRMTPAPQLQTAIDEIRQAGIEELIFSAYPDAMGKQEKGIHAPLVGVPVALRAQKAPAPDALYIAAFSSGFRLGWDKSQLPELFESRAQLEAWISRYTFAYPTRHRVQVAFSQELAYEQRLGLLVQLWKQFGTRVRIELLHSDRQTPPLLPDSGKLGKELAQRSRWRWPRSQTPPAPKLQGLSAQEPGAEDVATLHAFAQSLYPCLPELERTKVRSSEIQLELQLRDGALASWQWLGKAAQHIDPLATARFDKCVQHQASAFVLPTWRAPWRVSLGLALPPSARS